MTWGLINNDGKTIRLNLPPLTEERRRDLLKLVNNRQEECRVAIRNIRRDVITLMLAILRRKRFSGRRTETG